MPSPNQYLARGLISPSSPSAEIPVTSNVIAQVVLVLAGRISKSDPADQATLRDDSVLNLLPQLTLTLDNSILLKSGSAAEFFNVDTLWSRQAQVLEFNPPDINVTTGPTSFDFTAILVLNLWNPLALEPQSAGVSGARLLTLAGQFNPDISAVLTVGSGTWTLDDVRAEIFTGEHRQAGEEHPLLFLQHTTRLSSPVGGGVMPAIPLGTFGLPEASLVALALFAYDGAERSDELIQGIRITLPGREDIVGGLPPRAFDAIERLQRFGAALGDNPGLVELSGVSMIRFTRPGLTGLAGAIPVGLGENIPQLIVTTEMPTSPAGGMIAVQTIVTAHRPRV